MRRAFGLGLLAIQILAGASVHAQEPLDFASAFSRMAETPFMQISPDGTRLATAMGSPTYNRLIILDSEKLQPIPLKIAVRNVVAATWYDDRTLLVVAHDFMDMPQLYRADLDTGALTQITAFQANQTWETTELRIMMVSADRGAEVYLWASSYDTVARLYRIDVAATTAARVFSFDHPKDQIFLLGGENYLIEGWNSEHQFLLLEERSSTKAKELFKAAATDPLDLRVFGLAPDKSGAYVTAVKDGMRGIFRFDFGTLKTGPLLHGDARYDIEATPIVLPRTGEVLGATYQRDLPAAHYFDADIRGIMESVTAYKQGQFCIPTDADRNRSRLIIFCYADTNPGEYYIFRKASNRLDGIYSKAEWLLDMQLARMRPISYKARDGLAIEGYLTVPETAISERPLIVMPHGGPHVRDTWAFDPFAQYFAALGYAVLQPNYRMSTGYGESFHKKGWGQVGYAIQDDIFDGISWAQSQGFGKHGNICIVGASFGAYAALRAATAHPHMFKCVIALSGFYDIQSLLRADEKRSFYKEMIMLYGDPLKDGARHRAASALAAVDRLAAPILVVHGERDPRVSVKEARSLIARLTEAKKPHRVLLRSDEGHSFHKESNRRLLFLTMGEFLRQHLTAQPSGQ